MRKIIAAFLLSFTCAAALAGCRTATTGDGNLGAAAGGTDLGALGVDGVIKQLRDLTEELAGRVEKAEDTKAGVADAQKLLDARRGEMTARIGALKRGALAQDAAGRGRWLEAEVDGTQRVSQLKVKYLDASMRDPELKAALDRLAADYDEMFKDR
ncbi:MAG TPA: hypothetical protein VJ866_16355 [Pyrinomonadaceae bacterium]|nr:hypothetical protein [Pyrinomonadaceae bacterium]